MYSKQQQKIQVHKRCHETSRAIELLKNLADSMALSLLTSNFDRMSDRDQMSCLQQSGATSTSTTLPQMIE